MTIAWVVYNDEGDTITVFSSEKKADLFCKANNERFYYGWFNVNERDFEFEPYKHGLLFWDVIYSGTHEKVKVYSSEDGYDLTTGAPENMQATFNIKAEIATVYLSDPNAIPKIERGTGTVLSSIRLWARDAESAIEYAAFLVERIREGNDLANHMKGMLDDTYFWSFVPLGTWQDALKWEHSKGETRTAK